MTQGGGLQIQRGSVRLKKRKKNGAYIIGACARGAAAAVYRRSLQIGKVLHHQGGGVAKCPLF